jgi:hypothetical protein
MKRSQEAKDDDEEEAVDEEFLMTQLKPVAVRDERRAFPGQVPRRGQWGQRN